MLSLRNLVMLSTMWLVSCTNFCQNVADLGAVYQGGLVLDPAPAIDMAASCMLRDSERSFNVRMWTILMLSPNHYLPVISSLM